MDKEQYILEGLRQLHSKHYVECAKPDLQTLNIVIQEKVSEMFTKGTLDNETHRFLTDHQANLQCGRLYLLPKIHKIDGTVLVPLQTVSVALDGYLLLGQLYRNVILLLTELVHYVIIFSFRLSKSNQPTFRTLEIS